MISKNQIKLIQSLKRKKNRDELNLFVAEGEKLVSDLLPHFRCKHIFSTLSDFKGSETISDIEMKKITHLSTPSTVLAVLEKTPAKFDIENIEGQLSIALDDVQDPGNVGTILRIADWFGISHVFCSHACADVYNSKTVKATMGALARVKVFYVDLPDFLKKVNCPVYGTFMDGENIYTETLPSQGIIVMGNEGQGICTDVEKHINRRLAIPSFGKNGSESLNVAMATGIVCSEFRRRNNF